MNQSDDDANGGAGHFTSAYHLKTAEETIGHYRNWASSYDQEVGEDNDYAQPKRCADALQTVVKSRAAKLLDAGCGTGLSGQALAIAGFESIVGCDFSPDMLACARKKGIYQDLYLVDLNKGLPDFEDGSFDAVTAVGVFSFAHVDPQACDELLRVLKPGGAMVIGLNEKYWNEGALARKIEQLEARGRIREIAREYGDHLPGHSVMGWVLVLQKT